MGLAWLVCDPMNSGSTTDLIIITSILSTRYLVSYITGAIELNATRGYEIKWTDI